MHTNNLKLDMVRQLNQRIAKYFEACGMNLPALYQELCMAREAAVDEFERKEKGKYTCTIVE
jgi:hypothetical protein